ncbi:MAG: hypothetical protein GEV03_02155 [Streptosporangiales bacterium]|nr:hypothetical protein [Streptosporangiales bacterium]
MEIELATEAGSSSVVNEDFVVAVPGLVVVLDGVTRPPGTQTGCVHGTPWFVRQLGAAMLRRLVEPETPLVDAAAEAIEEVAARHADACDLTHPATPSTTLALLRERDGRVEYLLLGDSVILLERGSGLDVVTEVRNTAIVQADPAAPDRAITGSVPRGDLRRAAVLTDGASRFVDLFEFGDWRACLDLLDRDGPGGLIRHVREAERSDPTGRRWPRAKPCDDATAVLCRF